ncbi:MAG: FKBP-type peptidyl-prolyl cis-trans isomerase [Bacteroidota bacterium]
MRKLIFAWTIILFASLSCGKTSTSGCTPATIASENASMISYCTTNAINYSQHSSGILYEIITPGTGTTPGPNSRIYITYTGKLFDGTVFDSQSNPALTGWVLSTLVDGWKIGLPLIKKGGRIKLVIPSSLGYGCAGSGTVIPSNSPLYFDVTLIDVQ